MTGGIGTPVIYGMLGNPIVLIEAELDAMLVQQIVGHLCKRETHGRTTLRARAERMQENSLVREMEALAKTIDSYQN